MMKSKLMLLFALILLGVGEAAAQARKVTGKVIDEDGLPVIGASVVIDGTQIGVATDVNGVYVINNAPNEVARLRVYCVGMEPRVVAYKEGQTITMQSNAMLDEVMVVAYGTAKKSAFTGSAVVVDAEQLQKQTVSNVADALVGNVAGLQMRGSSGKPGASQGSINIRGIASMQAATDPLIIVDGAPYSASLTNINPNDIASVTVLKDAASAALYGARGAAGVILITTKKAEVGKSSISVDMKWGGNSRAVQQYKTIKDPAQFYEAYYSQLYNMYYYEQGKSRDAANQLANDRMLRDLQYNVYGGYTGNLIGLNGKLNPDATLGRVLEGADGTQYYLTADDWEKAAYHNALRQEYNVNMSGANAQGNYMASVGYLNEDGIIDYSSFERITARVKGEYQIKKWLKTGANLAYVHSNQYSTPNLDGSGAANLNYYTSNIAPIYPIYVRVLDANGNPTIKKDQYGHPKYDYGTANLNYPGIARTFMATGNPLGSNQFDETRTQGNQLNASFNAELKFTDWLKLTATSNVNWGESQYSHYENGFEGLAAATNGSLTKSTTTSLRTNNVQTLNFNKSFGDHNLSAMLGHEYYRTTTEYLYANKNGGFSEELKELNGFANIKDGQSYTSTYNVEGWFGNVLYDYNEKYFASASYRRDASSVFHPDHRWGNFWSAGAAWIISKEDFMENSKSWLNMLKLKFSVGQQGNDGIGNWAYVDMYTLSSNADKTGMVPTFWRLGNKEITWETTTNWNVGVEFGFFNNRLTGNVDVYYKRTNDLLFWLQVPESTGSRGFYTNIGDICNKGVEVTLDGHIVKSHLVDWHVGVNFSHNKNEILTLPEQKKRELGGFSQSTNGWEYALWMQEGGSLYQPFMAEGGVDETGRIFYWQDSDNAIYDANGKLTGWDVKTPGKKRDVKTYDYNNATNYVQKDNLPDLYGGFNTSLRIGSFDLNATFDFQIGGYVYDYRYMSLMGSGANAATGGTWHKDILNSWTPNNTETNIPMFSYSTRAQYNAAKSARFLTDASYLNFQSFTVGYTLPKVWKEISSMRVYVAGENLCFWSKRQGLDPRYAFDTNGSNTVFSPVRTISGGIQVTF